MAAVESLTYFKIYDVRSSNLYDDVDFCNVGITLERIVNLATSFISRSSFIREQIDMANYLFLIAMTRFTATEIANRTGPRNYKADSISMKFENWRFNLRFSNTKSPRILNMEALANTDKVQTKVSEIDKLNFRA